jgi:hypothetical protein
MQPLPYPNRIISRINQFLVGDIQKSKIQPSPILIHGTTIQMSPKKCLQKMATPSFWRHFFGDILKLYLRE